MHLQQLTYKQSTIGYYRFGSGPRVAVCFHGYGETAESFAFLAKYAGDQFSFYAIDLPFHGHTQWREGLHFYPDDLVQIVKAVTNSAPALTVVGFSLGGRMALALTEAMPEQVSKLVLLAPDGLKVNFWYWLSTQTWPGNRLFAFTMKHPGWFFGFLKALNKLRLVNASIFKFVNYYIGDAGIRQLLYNRWTALRTIRPNIARIKNTINENGIHVRLLYGKHDRIILSTVGQRFCRGIQQQCILRVIPSGHQVLSEKQVAEILPALLQ